MGPLRITLLFLVVTASACSATEPPIIDTFVQESRNEVHPATQRALFDDGVLTFVEYEDAIFDFRGCLTAAGFKLIGLTLELDTAIYGYSFRGEALAADGVCYAKHLSLVDPAWQLMPEEERLAQAIGPVRDHRIECHIENGIPFDRAWSNAELTENLVEHGVPDIVGCGR